jgi:hypothetical protein
MRRVTSELKLRCSINERSRICCSMKGNKKTVRLRRTVFFVCTMALYLESTMLFMVVASEVESR